jgi:hypothetical protein
MKIEPALCSQPVMVGEWTIAAGELTPTGDIQIGVIADSEPVSDPLAITRDITRELRVLTPL